MPIEVQSLTKSLGKFVTYAGTTLGAGFTAAAIYGHSAFASGSAAFFLTSAALGGVMWFTGHRRAKARYEERLEQRMLAVAKAKKGRVTDVELAAETRYAIADCRSFLKRMTETGSAEVTIGKEGTMVYVFPGFLSDTEKQSAKGIDSWTPPSVVHKREMGAAQKELEASQTLNPPPLERE